MILIDTSVWIEFLKQKEPFNKNIRSLLEAIIIKSVSEGNHLLWTLDKRMLKGIDPKLIYQA
ncbi:MAG: PIN domain nuclease [Bacteroidetes bacterium]|nr:PIN domain nuclease [Bacteroidota bacterium]